MLQFWCAKTDFGNKKYFCPNNTTTLFGVYYHRALERILRFDIVCYDSNCDISELKEGENNVLVGKDLQAILFYYKSKDNRDRGLIVLVDDEEGIQDGLQLLIKRPEYI